MRECKVVISGPPGAGKTTLLRLLEAAIRDKYDTFVYHTIEETHTMEVTLGDRKLKELGKQR